MSTTNSQISQMDINLMIMKRDYPECNIMVDSDGTIEWDPLDNNNVQKPDLSYINENVNQDYGRMQVLMKLLRMKRDELLVETDLLLAVPDRPNIDRDALIIYRQQLRDLPNNVTYNEITGEFEGSDWPIKP